MNQRATGFVCMFLLSLSNGVSQVNTASLTGLVRDPTTAIVPDAKVTAKSAATGIERSSQTNSSGYYFLSNLPLGDYEISVEKTGFDKSVSTVSLDATEKGRQDFTLVVERSRLSQM